MKIGITCYPTYGGSGVVAAELGMQLARSGHVIHFISSDLPSRLVELNERIAFHAVDMMAYPLFEYPPYALALATKMVEVVESEGLDLLHVHYAIPHAISAYLAKQMWAPQRLPVITTLHGTDITLVGNDRSYLPITRFGIEQSDGVTAVSQYLKEATYQELNVHKDITVIPNFVDADHFKRQYSPARRRKMAPKGEKLLIHVSNFRPIKRVTDVVHVFDAVRRAVPARLLMIGDGPERSNAEYLCRKLGIEHEVCFLGKYGPVEEYLSVSDLALMPSELESFGLAALEAMACEVPVIASRIGGLPELVVPGETGYLAPVGDITAMADAALRVLTDDGLAERLGAQGRRRAVEVFGTDRIVPLYEQLYIDVLEKV